MSMKKILMAAAAVTALTAGVANAASIDLANSKIGNVVLGSGTGSASVFDPYTLATETKLDTNTVFGNTTTPTGKELTLQVNTSSNTAVGIGEYLVTFNITNGSFDTSGLGTGVLATSGPLASAAGATPVVVAYAGSTTGTSTISAGTISFIVKVTAGNMNKMVLTVGAKTGTSRLPMTVSGSIVTLSGGVNVDGGSFGSVTAVDYRDGLLFNATGVNQTLSLASGFKKFTVASSADASEAIIGRANFTLNTTSITTGSVDLIYKDTATNPLALTDVSSAVLTVGGDLSAFNAKLGTGTGSTGSVSADVTTVPGVITANATNSGAGWLQASITGTPSTGGAILTLSQKSTPVVGAESAYTIAPVITMPSGLTPLTYAAKAIGSVSFEGTSFYAAWVGDGTNGITYSIRLGNRTATAVSSVKATLLNPVTTGTTGTVASTAACEVGPIAASGELIVSSDTLKTCFGAFKRSDVRFIIQASPSSMTAKMRTLSAGMVTEAPLGGGSDAAKAN